MDKKTLSQYRDLQREIKHLKKRLEKLKSEDYVFDRVSGSNPHFPYQQIAFHIEGEVNNSNKVEKLKNILSSRINKVNRLQLEIEEWICNIPDSRTRMIFEMRYIENKSWIYISRKFGSNNESYARMVHDRHLN